MVPWERLEINSKGFYIPVQWMFRIELFTADSQLLYTTRPARGWQHAASWLQMDHRHCAVDQFCFTACTSRNNYSTRHQIAYFKVTAKSYNVATRTAEPRRLKTAQLAA
jgi:hypothetical protein